MVFQPKAEPEPFNDSTAALNLQRRSSIPLLPAKFISRSSKPGKSKTYSYLDENENELTKSLSRSFRSQSARPTTVSVIMNNSTKITENLNLQQKAQKKSPTSAGKLHELRQTLQRTVKDQQIIRRSSSSFVGINSSTSTNSFSNNSVNSDSESESFHTSENTPSSIRSAPPTMLLLSPISSFSGQFSPSTFSPSSPPSPSSLHSSFSSNGTLSPPPHSGTLSPLGSPIQNCHNPFAGFAVNSSSQACVKPIQTSAAFVSGKESVAKRFPSTSTRKLTLMKSSSWQSHPNNHSSKYHLHNSIITEGDIGPPPTTIDYQTGEIILKR